jgi:histidinol-phosphate aminotransferase
MMPVFAYIFGLKVIDVPYDDDFKLDKDLLMLGDIIYIASPDNPTGTLTSLDDITMFCDSGKIVVLDETYCGFSDATAMSLINSYSNLYIVRSFSKSHGAAGIRIGMVISNQENIDAMIEQKPAYEINSVACEYLEFISDHELEFAASVGRILGGKELIEHCLIDSGFSHEQTFSNFVLTEFDQQLFDHISEVAKVAVVKVSNRTFLRITAPDTETARELIAHGIFKRNAVVSSSITDR